MKGDDVPRLEGLDARAGFDDLPQHFVPDDDRVVDRHPARPGVVDGEPGAACDHPRHRLAGPCLGVRPLFQDKRFVLLTKYHCFHRSFFGGCAAPSFPALLVVLEFLTEASAPEPDPRTLSSHYMNNLTLT